MLESDDDEPKAGGSKRKGGKLGAASARRTLCCTTIRVFHAMPRKSGGAGPSQRALIEGHAGEKTSLQGALFGFLDGWMDKEEQAVLGAQVRRRMPLLPILLLARVAIQLGFALLRCTMLLVFLPLFLLLFLLLLLLPPPSAPG